MTLPSLLTRLFLAVLASLSTVAALESGEAALALARLDENGMDGVIAAMLREDLLAWFRIALLIATAFVPVVLGGFLMLAHRRLVDARTSELRYRSGSAITMWWVPLINLVLPLAFIREVHGAATRSPSRSLMPSFLWFAFVVGSIELVVALIMPAPEMPGQLQVLFSVDAVLRALTALAALVMMIAVSGIARGLAAPPAEPAMASMVGHVPSTGNR